MKRFLATDPAMSLDDAFRTRVVFLFSLVLVIWAPIYSYIMFQLAPHWEVVISTMTAMVMVGISPFLLRRGVSFFIVGNWLAFTVYWEMIFVGAIAGYGPPPFYWLAVVPMVASIIAGLRSGLFWMGLSLVSLAVYYSHLYAVRGDALVLSPGSQIIFDVSVLAGLYILVMLLSLSSLRAKDMAVSQLKASEERGRKIVEKAADAILTVDADATICSANEACAEIFGYPEQELLGRPLSQLAPATGQIPPDPDPEGDAVVMARFDPEGEPAEQPAALRAWSGHYYETLGIRQDGQTVPLEIAIARLDLSKSERFVVVVRDLRVRKKLEEQRKKALQQSKESFRALIENLPNGLIVHRQGQIRYLNPAAGELLGCQNWRELLGSPIDDLLPREERQQFFDLSNRARLQGESPQAQEHHFKTPQGERVPVESLTFEAIFQNEEALISIVRDLTETRQMRLQMMQMERMSAVGTLAAGVAHEINNPLTYVAGNLLFVLEELHEFSDQVGISGREDSQQDSYIGWSDALHDALEGTERIRKIVTDLRSYSQKREPEIKPVDLREVVETAINMASHEIKHRAQLIRDFQQVDPVLADPAGLGQVVLNLLINAAHAITPGSVEQQEVQVRIRQDGDQIFIEVRDTGTGIADDVLPQIFDPFFTTKSGNQGTGLGLAICQNIMQSFGGDLTVETAVGEGTTMVARLPATPAPEELTTGEQPEHEKQPTGTPRILIIDDDPMVRRTLTRRLAKNYEVQDVSSSTEALDKLSSTPFDIILCDLMMPEETGMEFFERLKSAEPHLKDQVIFITGGAVTQDAADFLEKTNAAVLKKPFRHRELQRQINDTLDK